MEEGERARTGIGELDRVLGGGVVRGSVVLVGGSPERASPRLLHADEPLAGRRRGSVLYVSGEESAAQVKMRAERSAWLAESLYFLAETDLTVIEAHVAQLAPRVLVVDSIQTMFLPGSSRRREA